MSSSEMHRRTGQGGHRAFTASHANVSFDDETAPPTPAIEFDSRIVGSFVRSISSPAAFAVEGESCGLLLGRTLSTHPARVVVEGYHPMASDGRRGGAPHLLPEQEEALEQMIAGYQGRLVGMYRTCRTGSLALTPEDQRLLGRFCSAPQSVYLLLRPRSLTRAVGALYRKDSLLPGLSVPVEIVVPAAIDVSQPDAAAWNHSRIGRAWQVIAVAAGLLVPAVWMSRSAAVQPRQDGVREDESGRPSRVRLEILRAGGDLLISWKPVSAASIDLVSGRLSITDSGSKREILLGREELASGRLLYQPLTSDISITLQATTRENRLVTDSLRAVYGAMEPPRPITALLRPSSIDRPRTSGQTEFEVRTPVRREPRSTGESSREEQAGHTALGKRLSVPAPGLKSPPEISIPEAPDIGANLLAFSSRPFIPESSHRTPEWRMPARREPSTPLSLLSPRVVPASAISTVQPAIPSTARRYIRGPIVIRIVASVDANGRVVSASAPPQSTMWEAQIAQAARDAASKWRFKPPSVDGRSVPGEVTISFRFVP